jgi:N,N'-diacetylchitobiose transport system permease protein
MLVGMLLALLLTRVSRWARITLTTVLLFVWSLPAIVASQIFLWLFDNNFGVVNYLLSRIPGVHMQGHDWFVNSNQGLYMVIAAVVIWGAVPFLTLTLHAGLTQVPRELREAAVMDGASSWRVFRNVTLPFLWPLIVIIGTLSIIWDFSVFNQIYAMRSGSPEEGYQNLPVYMYERGFGGQDYNMGSTIAILMIILMFVLILFYIRQLFKIGDAD